MTNLERLAELNQEAMQTRKRRRKAPSLRYPESIEREYLYRLEEVVTALADYVRERLYPLIKELQRDYREDFAVTMGDSVPVGKTITTNDAWADVITQALEQLADEYTNEAFVSIAERFSSLVVNNTVNHSSEEVARSVNAAIGVNIKPLYTSSGMYDYINAAIKQNVELIKSLPSEFTKRTETIILQGMMDGERYERIAAQLEESYGIAARRARTIARDQVSKINGQVVERRQKQAGISYWRWVTSKDERVGADHRLAASRDIGYGPGVYPMGYEPKEGRPGNATRPNCRCTASPVFEWELP